MPLDEYKKRNQKRWHIITMRPQGQTSSLAVAPVYLLVGIVFALIFTGAGVLAISNYFTLSLDYRDLKVRHDGTSKTLERVRKLYDYQALTADECLKLLYAAPDNESQPSLVAVEEEAPLADDLSPAAPVVAPPQEESLQSWSRLFPDPPENSTLDVEQFKVMDRNFRFRLTNSDPSGRQARGNLLMLFEVETGDKIIFVPSPEFNDRNPKPDFTPGPSYNIRSSKIIRGHLEIPPGSKVLKMMVMGLSQSGQIVLKKSVAPTD